MANYTPNFNLKKPDQKDFYNVDDFNGNADIVDAALKKMSENSGVIIGADEPETGEVWIDTNNEDETGHVVISVNGKIGEVQLTAKDVDAYSVGETYNKTEIANLMKNKAPAYTYITSTLTASAWSNGSYSFESTYPNAKYDIEISVDDGATTEQVQAFALALICGSHNTNVITAKGTVPTVDIPIIIKVVAK